MGDDADRFLLQFRRNTIPLAVPPLASVVFGDFTYSAGSFSYYWRNPEFNAVILREQKLRGVGFELQDGLLHRRLGQQCDCAHRFRHLPVQPHRSSPKNASPSRRARTGCSARDIGRYYTYAIGTEIQYSKSVGALSYGVTGTWGTHPFHGKAVHALLLEPSMNYKFFSLGFSYYQGVPRRR